VTAPSKPVALFILPFRNASGDGSWNWLGPALANMLRTEVGQSAVLRIVPGDRVGQILQDLRIGQDANLDRPTLATLGQLSSADTVVWGQYVLFDKEIRIDATLQDLANDRTVPLKARARREADLPEAIAQLAESVRANVALAPQDVKALAAHSLKPSTKSVHALRYYTEGLDLSRVGKDVAAAEKFLASIGEDPNFALASAKLAQTYASMGESSNADKYSRSAVGLSDSLPEPEKYQVLATRARIVNDYPKAVEYYERLDKLVPHTDDVVLALATVYEETGEYDKASARFAELLERDPKYVDALLGAGRVKIRSGRPDVALDDLNRALVVAIQRGNDEAKAAALRMLGLDYRTLNKLQDALRSYTEALEIEQKMGRMVGIADTLNGLAQVQDSLGQSDAALKSYLHSLDLRRRLGDQSGIGALLIDLGVFYALRSRYDEALTQFKEALQVERELHNTAYEGLALNNIGTVHLTRGDYEQAQTYFQQALTVRERINVPSDTADTLHNLAETSTKIGAYETALARYVKAIELRRQVGDKRGTAIEQYNLGNLFEYQGRYGAALDSKTEALQIFRSLDEHDIWLPKVLASYGHSLGYVRRTADAQKALGEARPLAEQLHDQELAANIAIAEGDARYYAGDFAGARRAFQQALGPAARAKLSQAELVARMNLAKLALVGGQAPGAATFQALGGDADRLGLKFEAVECALLAGEADYRSRQYVQARSELEAALSRADRLGARTLVARAHYWLGKTLAAAGDQTEARRHMESARQALDQIKTDARTDAVLERPDLKPILEESKS
jgi:tetratricopeptide (TPR) repeat protein